MSRKPCSGSILFRAMSPGCFASAAYILAWLRSMDPVAAQRAIATLHSFRFFGLVFLLPGVVSPNLPRVRPCSRWGDFATGVLAMSGAAHDEDAPAVLAVRRRLQSR